MENMPTEFVACIRSKYLYRKCLQKQNRLNYEDNGTKQAIY